MQPSLKSKYIGDKAFYRRILVIALPIMIQNFITNFVSLLDNIMVGRVGTVQMTGVAIVNQLIFVFNLAVFGAVSGAGIFTAQFHGKADHEGVRFTFRFKIIICAILCFFAVGIFLFFGENLILLYLKGDGTSENISASLGYAKTYLLIMLIGIIPFSITQCYAGTLRETGETVLPMSAGLISVGVNLLFNTLLIFGFLGFPKLGSAGAAIATVIARFVEASVVVVWTHTHSQKHSFIKGAFRRFCISAKLAGNIARKGLPLLLNETLWGGGMAILTQCYSLRGYNVVAAVNITSTLTNLFNVAIFAMGNAIGIIIGQMLGRGDFEKAADADRKMILIAFASSFVLAGMMAAISSLFPAIYNTEPEVRALASALIKLAAVCMPINALAHVCYYTLRSGGKILITILFDSFYVWMVCVPLAFVLSRFTSLSIISVYFFCNIIEVGKCIVGIILIKKGVWLNNIAKKE